MVNLKQSRHIKLFSVKLLIKKIVWIKMILKFYLGKGYFFLKNIDPVYKIVPFQFYTPILFPELYRYYIIK